MNIVPYIVPSVLLTAFFMAGYISCKINQKRQIKELKKCLEDLKQELKEEKEGLNSIIDARHRFIETINKKNEYLEKLLIRRDMNHGTHG